MTGSDFTVEVSLWNGNLRVDFHLDTALKHSHCGSDPGLSSPCLRDQELRSRSRPHRTSLTSASDGRDRPPVSNRQQFHLVSNLNSPCLSDQEFRFGSRGTRDNVVDRRSEDASKMADFHPVSRMRERQRFKTRSLRVPVIRGLGGD